MEEMKRRLVEAIKDCNELCRDCDTKACEGCFLLEEYEKEAEAVFREMKKDKERAYVKKN